MLNSIYSVRGFLLLHGRLNSLNALYPVLVFGFCCRGATLQYLVRSSKAMPMVVIILDEIDQLATKDNNVLYKTFSWAQRENSTVVLLGIANGLDLTERVLPMLSGRGYGAFFPPISPMSLPHFRLYEVVSLHMCALPYKYPYAQGCALS